MSNSKISIILPTYNEKDNVLPLIKAIHAELCGYDHELLVVDDNSSDGTEQAVADLKDPLVKFILRTKNVLCNGCLLLFKDSTKALIPPSK